MARRLPSHLRDFLDYGTTRQRVFSNVLDAVKERYPLENDQFRLEVSDLAYEGPEHYSLKKQKEAILRRQTLSRNLMGTWNLVNKGTGQVADSRRTRLARVPYLTGRGTYIRNGNEFTVANQLRLKSGVYTRTKDNGDHEAHFNILRGGPSFRIFMEPKTGIFRLRVGQSHLPIYPIMRAMGVTDANLVKLWGPELFAANQRRPERGESTLAKAWARLANTRAKQEIGEPAGHPDMRALLDRFELDPDVTEQTLGQRFERVTPEAMLRTMEKLVNISQGRETTDDRDSLAYQDTHSAEDFFRERITKDAGRLGHRLLWKATMRKNLSGIHPGALTPQMDVVFNRSGMAQPLEEINPLDVVDQNLRVIRMGEGGIASGDAVPSEARGVQPSYFSFIDPVRGPESGAIGVDSRIATEVAKGDDKKLYTKIVNVRTGEVEYQHPGVLTKATIAFPGELERVRKSGGNKVKAMRGGKIRHVNIDEVDYAAPNAQGMFNVGSNLVPMISAIKGGRLLMGGKVSAQALPLREPEAPLVQSVMPDEDRSYEAMLGKYSGAVRSGVSGVVTRVDSDSIVVAKPDGTKQEYELYNNFPLNRQTYTNSFPQVARGDRVKPGQLLATSNFTDKEGTLALGKNLRVAYIPYKGLNFEDAIVVSEGAAQKLASEHLYTEKIDADNMTAVGMRKFISTYPATFNRAQVAKMDDRGVIREGETVEEGDPLILAVQKRTPRGAGMLYRGRKSAFSDASVTWKHASPGVVTDVWSDKGGVKVAVRAYSPLQVGDKITGRHGGKGVVSRVVPDDQMPIAEDGKPAEVLSNPLGILTRSNPAQLVEAILGKIAAKTGKPYKMPGFTDEDLVEFAIKELEANGMKDTEDLVDPESNRTIPGVFTGNRFYMKLLHTAESKGSARALGAYTMEGVPSQTPGAKDKPKRIGSGEMQALVSHNALENIRDIKNVRGRRNDDYWRAMMLGYPPPTPEVPTAYKKFLALMQGAGINVKKQGNYLHLTAMTDRDVDKMSSGEITKPATVKWETEYKRGLFGEKSMDPVQDGLFDRGVTGSHGGNRWAHLTLPIPLPQPAMEDPIRRLLGLTGKEFEAVIGGQRKLNNFGTGPKAIHEALKRIKVDDEIVRLREDIKSTGSASRRDDDIKKLKDLWTMKKQGMRPSDLMVTKVPVIPPIFRPITATKDFTMVAGVNELYLDMMNANDNYRQLAGKVGGELTGDAQLNMYRAFKAITGLGDPIRPRSESRSARGLLKEIFGGRAKHSLYQRKLLGTPVDLAARATIIPNPALDMDQIGMPEDRAWELYSPFVVRRLVKRLGGKASSREAAIRMVSTRSPRAREILVEEMGNRPVLATRAPALHRYSLMAFMPVLTPGKTLQLSPAIVPGMNADFDGDAANFHVVVSDKAVEEAKEKMLPSRNLRSPADFATLWLPRQEFLQGLYLASTKRSGRKALPAFDSIADVIAAYKRGEVDIEDVVSVKEKAGE
jgi:DNA-directed RNA polymerase beta subunit